LRYLVTAGRSAERRSIGRTFSCLQRIYYRLEKASNLTNRMDPLWRAETVWAAICTFNLLFPTRRSAALGRRGPDCSSAFRIRLQESER